MSGLLEELLLRVESAADWRDYKATQYPDDKRNGRSSAALKTLAKNLQILPSHPGGAALAAYEDVMERALGLEDALYRISEVEQRYISRYGFDYPQDGNPASFLGGLTEEAAEIVKNEEEQVAERESEAKYEAAKQAADEAAKEAAHETATEAAKEAAKVAAEEAYKVAYEATYQEIYEETYKEALIGALED